MHSTPDGIDHTNVVDQLLLVLGTQSMLENSISDRLADALVEQWNAESKASQPWRRMRRARSLPDVEYHFVRGVG